VASVDPTTGLVTALKAGTTNIIYTVSSGCNAPKTAQQALTVVGDGTISFTSASGTNAQTKCVNTAIANITYAVGGTSTGATVSGLPNGVTGTYNSGVVTISGTPTEAGTFNYTVNTTGSPCVNPTATGSIVVTPNTICATYTGPYLVNTSSTTTGGTATFNLSFTISGLSGANCNSLSGLQSSNFTVIPSPSSGVSIGQISYNASTNVVSAPVTVVLSSNQYSSTIQFNLTISNGTKNFVFGNCVDVPLVTVSTLATGFVTGGGYIIPTTSNGTQIVGANGNRNNFGFNIKYNKSQKQLQGNWNTIVRSLQADGKIHLFQVKSSQPYSLVVGQISATSYRADMVFTAANIQDLTTGQGFGTGTAYVTVYDNGEPGINVDQIYIKVVNNGSKIYESSLGGPLNTSSYQVPKLNAGNIQIHTFGGPGVSNNLQVQTIDQPSDQRLKLNALPNPSRSSFTLQLHGSASEKMQVRVVDVMGRTVQLLNNLSSGQTLNLGADYKVGVYIVELSQGGNRTQTKIVKTN
ncbi:T9SS type A sorting domain-containing protein, partial [Flavisolibacter nicotianae]|uniref:T9SS type A sorting domain-containing protein n=1 Tax=Flavisolibacter nicotianae TaxID=2364882 RepID=UPI0013C49B3A